MMKFITSLVIAAGVAVAVPAGLTTRQFGGITRNDLEDGSSSDCPQAILIFARATGEGGNIGASTGRAVANSLEREFDDIWIQGVGGPYRASIGDNILPRGSSSAAIGEGIRLFELANSKCPDAAVVTGGYSQGSALIAAALSDLDTAVREQVKGAVLFGYTQNQQNDEQIPNFPSDRTEIFCNTGDLVCDGTLIVAAPHFAYTGDARGPAADFLASQITAA